MIEVLSCLDEIMERSGCDRVVVTLDNEKLHLQCHYEHGVAFGHSFSWTEIEQQGCDINDFFIERAGKFMEAIDETRSNNAE